MTPIWEKKMQRSVWFSYMVPPIHIQDAGSMLVMGKTEELTVGFACTLPCQMLLGSDWPYFCEVMEQAHDHRKRYWRPQRKALWEITGPMTKLKKSLTWLR